MIKTIINISIASLILVGCGKPNDPEDYTGGYKIVKKHQTNGYANDLIVRNNLCYIAQGEGKLGIVDISNPNNPVTITNYNESIRGYSTKIEKKDSVVYLSAGAFGVSVINVIDPLNPTVSTSNINIKPAKNLYVMQDYLVTSIGENGFNMTYIGDPVYVDIRGTTHTDGYVLGLTVSADQTKLFATTGEIGLSIYDISVLDNGYGIYPKINSIDLPGYVETITLNGDESLAFFACGTAGLQVVDCSDVTNLSIIGSLDTGGYAKELVYENNKIYLTAESAGLQIIDVADATNPKLLGVVDTEFALGLDVDENYIYVADEDEGLIIIGK